MYRIYVCSIFFFSFQASIGQSCDGGGCSNFVAQFPSGTFSTTSSTWTNISTTINAGNWTLFAVTAGNTYEWTYCSSYGGALQNWDAEITLYNNANNARLCYQNNSNLAACPNAPYLRWTATFTGTVKLLTSVVTSQNCQSNTGSPRSSLAWRQSAQGCTGWVTTPTSAQFTNSGGNGTFAVNTTTGGCAYSVISNNNWINTLTTTAGTVGYHVDVNTGSARAGTISIRDANLITQTTFTVNQDAQSNCSPTASVNSPSGTSPVTIICTASGGSGGSYAYKWYSGTSCTGSVLGTNSTLSVTTTGNYSCKVYITGNESTCFGCATGTATVNAPICTSPNATVNSPTGTSSTIITCTVSGGSGGSINYKWYSGNSCTGTTLGTNSTLNVTSSGNYTCKAYITGNESNCFQCATGYATVNLPSNPISGTVYDYSGANATASLFPNVTVELQNSNGGLINTTSTNSSGYFQFPNLSGTNYKIKVSSGIGQNFVSGTTSGVNPGTNLSIIKLPYTLHQQASTSNSNLASHQFDYSIGYIFTAPAVVSAFNTSIGANALQSDLGIFNSNIDTKIQALQRMYVLCRIMKVVADNEAEIIQQTTEEILNAIDMICSTREFLDKFDMLLDRGGLNLARWLSFKLQRELLLAKTFIVKKTLDIAISSINNPNFRLIMKRLLDGGFELMEDYLRSDDRKDFNVTLRTELMKDIVSIVITPTLYKAYFTMPIQNNLNQAITNLSSLNFSGSTSDAVSRLIQIQSNSGTSYAQDYTDLVFYSTLAEGLSTGSDLFDLGRALALSPATFAATKFSSTLLRLGAFASEGVAIGSGIRGILKQKEYAVATTSNATQRISSSNTYPTFIDSVLNDSLHVLYLQANEAVTRMENDAYSHESISNYVNIDSVINRKVTNLVERLKNQFSVIEDSTAIDSLYKYLAITNTNFNLRSNLNWLVYCKLNNTVDSKLNDSLYRYSTRVKADNLIADSILHEAALVSSNMETPAYFTIDKIIYPNVTDTGLNVPVTLIVKLHSDTTAVGHVMLSGLSNNVDSISKVFLPNQNDTSILHIHSGSIDSVIFLFANINSVDALEASRSMSVNVQSFHPSISISGNTILCSNDSAKLIANAPTNFKVRWKEQNLNSVVGTSDTLTIYSGFGGVYTALFTDTLTAKTYFASNSIEIKNSLPQLGPDKSINVICSNEVANISNLYNTNGLSTVWNLPNPAMANLGVHRLIVTNSMGCKDTAFVTVKQDIETWIGTISDDWHNPLNWSNNLVPTETTHVIVGPTYYPCIIKNGEAFAASIKVKPNGFLKTNTNQRSFVKAKCSILPEVGNLTVLNTSSVNNITTGSASAGGIIINSGGTLILARGVCWSTTPNPTIANRRTLDGTGLGTFTSSITNLSSNTTYYLRAYATNSAGTNYGNNISFTTISRSIADIDGNTYPVITIGNQNWTSRNLEVVRYTNGDTIPQITDATQWANLTTGAWCYLNNDPTKGPIYGKLYNWYAVTDPRGLAPQGWHVPSDNEWTIMTNFLGGLDSAGGKMKAVNFWGNVNNAVTNLSGFTALPGKYRFGSGIFYSDVAAEWWSKSVSPNFSDAAMARLIFNVHNSVYVDTEYFRFGFSVRCIKD